MLQMPFIKKKREVVMNNYINYNSKVLIKEDQMQGINGGISENSLNYNNTYCASRKTKKVDKIEFNKICIYFCCLCVRKIKNINNILLNKGIKIFREKMDIFTIFKKLNQKKKRRI